MISGCKGNDTSVVWQWLPWLSLNHPASSQTKVEQWFVMVYCPFILKSPTLSEASGGIPRLCKNYSRTSGNLCYTENFNSLTVQNEKWFKILRPTKSINILVQFGVVWYSIFFFLGLDLPENWKPIILRHRNRGSERLLIFFFYSKTHFFRLLERSRLARFQVAFSPSTSSFRLCGSLRKFSQKNA